MKMAAYNQCRTKKKCISIIPNRPYYIMHMLTIYIVEATFLLTLSLSLSPPLSLSVNIPAQSMVFFLFRFLYIDL